MTIPRTKFLILGAGPTGLGAAYRLAELGQNDFLIYDASDDVGGLARSFVDPQGFTWDIGGHVQFSHYPYYDALLQRALGSEGWNHIQRQSWVWMRGRFIPYPLQNHLRYLPVADQWRCVQGLLDARRHAGERRPEHFEAWMEATFGAGLSALFMKPYNFKVWAYPPSTMSYQWIGERVATTDLERVLRNIILQEDELSWGPNNRFIFPKKGGTGAIWQGVARIIGRERIRLNCAAVEIHSRDKWVRFADGSRRSFEYLLSTLPLNRLASLVVDLKDQLIPAANRLVSSASNIVGIGLEGAVPAHLRQKCWMYFPEDDCPFYRVTVFSNYAKANVPDPERQWSLMAEVSESPAKAVRQESIIRDVRAGLERVWLLPADARVVTQWTYRAEQGYPVPSLGRDALLARLHYVLEPCDIFSRGRFGGWKYEVSNQDHSVMQGVEWVNRVVQNLPEKVYERAAKVAVPSQVSI